MVHNTSTNPEHELDKIVDCLDRIEEIVINDVENLEDSEGNVDKIADLMALYCLPFSYTKLTSSHIMIDRLLELDEKLNIIAIDDQPTEEYPLSFYLYSLAVELDYLEPAEKDLRLGFEKFNRNLLGK